ncbi:unnamed protein product [Cuscuta europaea]|uniref:Uncharacterized protein n=1 Tax=Cuscuta europaea TaxID=41803 RepID=A0A9P1EEV2_CUSEU|nr:unnamed protein product [Cuscuta europaea]
MNIASSKSKYNYSLQLERGGGGGGCPASRIWSTTAFMNGFTLSTLAVEDTEECIALTALKVYYIPSLFLFLFFPDCAFTLSLLFNQVQMGIYSLLLREARLAKERDLIVAKENAEHASSSAIQAAEADRKKMEAEVRELRVKMASLLDHISAAEAAQVKFQEAPSQIPNGLVEMMVDLSAVRESFKSSEEFLALKEEYALEQLHVVFGRHLAKLGGEERQKEGVRMLDQHPVTKWWVDTLAQEVYGAGCQHMLQLILPLLEKLLGQPVQPSDFSGLHPDQKMQAGFGDGDCPGY